MAYDNVAGIHRMTIDSTGKVGIGATSPGNNLQVDAADNGGGITIQSTGVGLNRAPALHLNPLSTSASERNWAISPYRDVVESLSFLSSNAKGGNAYTAGTTRLIINGISGNVGIGMTDPGVPLDVSGKVRIRNVGQLAETVAQLNISSSGASQTETRAIDIVGAWSGGENKSITYSYGGGGILGQTNFIYNGPGAQYRWGKLYYSGASSTYTMFLTATSTTTADLTVSGNITASADVVAYSDKRLKSNIKTLDGSKVLKMRGVSFEKEGKKRQWGYSSRIRKRLHLS